MASRATGAGRPCKLPRRMTNLPFDKLALAFEGLALAAQPSGIVCRIVAILGLPALRSFGDTLPALSAGVSPDSVGRRRSFPLSRPASLPRLGQLAVNRGPQQGVRHAFERPG